MSNVGVTRLSNLHSLLAEEFMVQLQPQPVLTKDGEPVYIDGKLLTKRAPASVLKELREFLKDNGIDQEPLEGTPVRAAAKALRQFDDDPLDLPAPTESK